MKPPSILPDQVFQEIYPFFSDQDEEIIDAISPTTGPIGKLGELWIILTPKTVLFYTKEYKKDPVVALIARNDLKSVQYEQHPLRTTQRFIPIAHPKNPITVQFPQIQKNEMNKFCEELAETTPFELVVLEKKAGTSARPVTGQSDAVRLHQEVESGPSSGMPSGSPQSDAPPAVGGSLQSGGTRSSSTSSSQQHHSTKPSQSKSASTQASGSVSSSFKQPSFTESSTGKRPDTDPLVKIVKGPISELPKIETSGVDVRLVSIEPPVLKMAAITTFVSVIVGYLWYSLFRALAD